MGCAGCAAAGVLGAAVFRKRTEGSGGSAAGTTVEAGRHGRYPFSSWTMERGVLRGHSAPPGKAAVRFSGGGQQLSRTMS